MSIIITQVFDDRIVMGADSAVTYLNNIQYIEEGTKLFQTESDFIVGFVGDAEHASILKFVLNEIDEVLEPRDDVILGIYASYAKTAHDFGVELRTTSEDGMSGPTDAIHLAYRGKAWQLHGYRIREIADFSVSGCAAPFALGALYAGGSMEVALNAAAKYDPHCSAPFLYYEMKDNIITKSTSH